MTAETKLAEQFHEAYERLAPSFGYETRPDTKKFDPESVNGRLMIAVCKEVIGNAIERLQADIVRYQTSGAELHLALEKVIAERDALREYARHSEGCSAVFGDQYRCRCGFRDIAPLAAQEKP